MELNLTIYHIYMKNLGNLILDVITSPCTFSIALDGEIIAELRSLFHKRNCLVKDFKSALEDVRLDDLKVIIREDKYPSNGYERRFNVPMAPEVAEIQQTVTSVSNRKELFEVPHKKISSTGRSTRNTRRMSVRRVTENSKNRETRLETESESLLQKRLKLLNSTMYDLQIFEQERLLQELLKHSNSESHDVKLNAYDRFC
ncbi:hypothetical protein TNCT_611831 [Trichonephila clavata]|uniref:Uncharacterized protein n=1 Tax=Trichonephila clavata TaxID=2740835 RepID=A0A8X6JNH6_TRICU|nr:hypothetical protein TNCT_611831 [Trichonephila clavata]